MNRFEVKCQYSIDCSSRGSGDCKKCRHNELRNKEINYFEAANDNPIPVKCPPISYSGPAEQTAGYKCPVCNQFTSPYSIRDSRCSSCGYKLNCR